MSLTRRTSGATLMLVGILLTGQESAILNWLAWIALAGGAYLLTEAIFAILVTVFALSLTHYVLTPAPVYGWVMLISGVAVAAVSVRRFHSRILATREARWRHRKSSG